MRDNVATDGFGRTASEERSAVDLRNDLIRNDYGDAKLIGQPLQLPEELSKTHLPGGQLATAGVVCAIQGSRRVNHEQSEAILHHQIGGLHQKLILLISRVHPRESDVLQHSFRVKLIALSDRHNALWPEGALAVDIHRHTSAAAVLDFPLACDAQLMAELSLARAILAIQLCDSTGLDAAL